MVLVSGKNRADLQILSQLTGEDVQPAKPKTVLALTGYPVGAVPPIGGKGAVTVIMDVDLMLFKYVWASAGSSNILMRITPSNLQKLLNNEVKAIKQT